MYRIRRLTGGEVNLASLDELTAAVAAGTVTADAEIFHQRAERWLPIASHPHFRIAKDRSQSPARSAPRTSPTPAPAPAQSQPQPQQPVLRLVRSDMSGTPTEPKPTARWTPPQRSMPVAPRVTGSAAPAAEPQSQFVEFVAEKPEPAPAPAPAPTLSVAAEPARPKRVDPATAGLPMLDIEMPMPPRPLREPTPMPTHAKMQMPLALPEPGPVPLGARLATPMPSPAMAPIARSAPKLEPTPLPQPALAPAPVAVAPVAVPTPAPIVVPEPVSIAAPSPDVAVEAHTEPTMPLPWAPPTPLDLPPAVLDFSEPTEAAQPEFGMATSAVSRGMSRWPMLAGALVVIGIVAFLALRPRGDVESLDPKPAPTAPAVAARPAATTTEASTRPQITPVVPPGPSPESQAVDAPSPDEPVVVPVAPKLRGGVPSAVLGNVGDLNVQMDPTAAQRQKSLDETRKQIETQMQQ